MIYKLGCYLMLNYLLTILLYFQLYDTFLFSSAIELNSDLKKINDWAFQWKMTFNSDRSKQAQEIMSSRKLKKATHSLLLFNNNNVSQVNSQKHLGVILDVNI